MDGAMSQNESRTVSAFRSAVSVAILLVLLSSRPNLSLGTEPEELPVSARLRDPVPAAFHSGPVPRTEFIADDASLNDVCGIGNNCWAVGERGVIVRSSDAGETWTAAFGPRDCSLKSVCFLTSRIGFVAGAGFNAFDRRYQGILLVTRDGGDSWTELTKPPGGNRRSEGKLVGAFDGSTLPPLTFIRFFDLERGIAVAAPDRPRTGSLLLRTNDGGATWKPLATDEPNVRWKTAAFLSPQDGILVGRGNASGAVVAERIITLAQPQRTLRSMQDTSLWTDGSGWMAGDGGTLLHSQDGGVTWRPPASELSPLLNDLLDYASVDHRGPYVCVAGSPGSIVLHSADGGQSWSFRQLSSPVPVRRVRFVGEDTVIAVGAFGIVHRSTDAGLSWTTVRNSSYRAAVLCLATNPADISLRLLSDISGDQGYRSVVVQPSARLPRDDADDALAKEHLDVSVASAGATAFCQDWMFSRTQPLQHVVREELLKTWSRQTDGRLSELLPQRLAETIRIWRPDVICIDRGSEDDQVADILRTALDSAAPIAAGTDPRGAILDRVGLSPWTVSRIVVRLTGDDQSPLSFRGDAMLPNLATTTDLIAEFARAAGMGNPGPPDESIRHPAADAYAVQESGKAAATPRHLLSGFQHAPGSASRRDVLPLHEEQLSLFEDIIQRHRTQRAAVTGHLNTAGTPLALIAKLKTVGRDLPDRLALQQLLHLADLYESLENLEGQIAVLKELTERFPTAPETADAAELLFQFYSSSELRFLRRLGTGHHPQPVGASGIQQAASRIPGLVVSDSATQPPGTLVPAGGILKPSRFRPGSGTSLPNSGGRDTSAVDAVWDSNAEGALQLLGQLSPDRADSARVLLRQAANQRRREKYGENSTILSQAATGEDLYAVLARGELQAVHGAAEAPVPVITLPRAEAKPILDGNLTEACWQDASELHLRSASDEVAGTSADCLVMLAWDDDHLYLGGRVEFVEPNRQPLDRTVDRFHDAGHADRDRIQFTFDTDRDYTTGFQFTIDESGQTSERCWRAVGWNPEWFVAEDADQQVWRFEAAIPQSQLVPEPIRAGSIWAIQIQRLVPGVLTQSLSNSELAGPSVSTNGFGLLRFIRKRN